MGATLSGLQQPPIYEASARVLVVDWGQEDLHGGEIQPLPPPGQLQTSIPAMMQAIDSRPVAEEALERLELQMGAAQLLENLTVEQVGSTSFIALTYEDTDPMTAKRVANTVGEVFSELISERSSDLAAKVFEKAARPESPVSPHPWRNGLLTLVLGLVMCAATALALPGVGARAAGTLGERPSRQRLSTWYSDHSIVERVKEKKLLRALGRRGKLTAVEASLESELSVDEANRILEELAFAGHLEVTVEDGRVLYSFWGEHGA
jgi:capsular polysaccharide biosynthesis protein